MIFYICHFLLSLSSFFSFRIPTLELCHDLLHAIILEFWTDSSNLKQRKTKLHYMDDDRIMFHKSLFLRCANDVSRAKFTLKCIAKTILNISKALLLHKKLVGHSSWKFGQGCTTKALKPQPTCITDEAKLLLSPSAKQR